MGRFQDISRKLEGAEASLKWEVPVISSGAPPPVRDRIQRIRRELGAVEPPPPEPIQRPKRTSRPLAAGDRVFIRGMNLQGTVSRINDQSDEARVSIGSVGVSVETHRLSRIEEDDQEATRIRRISSQLGPCPRARQPSSSICAGCGLATRRSASMIFSTTPCGMGSRSSA